ncbi:hypothetical protein MHU86_14403 [Fragilaria crotonensis]|nr:hypothetical protein MHU86_14403 [Fragilaria crotonensis]
MPDQQTGLSPHNVFTKTRWEQKKLMDVHVWGCPVYVLDKMISDGKKLPCWTPRSTRTVNLGFSDKHASLVLLVLNPQTGYITQQFHIVFGDWFASVPASADDLPNFNDDCWQRMFQDATFQYVLNDEDEDEEWLIAESTDFKQANEVLSQMQRVATALDNATPPQVLPSPPTPIRPANESDKDVSKQPDAPKATKAKSTPVKHVPRRSTRNRSAPVCLRYDGQQGHGYNAEFNVTSLEWLYNEVAEYLLPPPLLYKESVSDPDTLSFNEAMSDRDNIEKWFLKAANDKIQFAEKCEELKLTCEGTFTNFLGINFTPDATNGTLTLTLKGLIQKIKEATGMFDSNYNWTPAAQAALGINPDGPPLAETWSYRSIVGMLLYLSTNTRPDIAFAVSQVTRFCHKPKRSHASAVKTLICYLHRTCDMGMIVKPTGTLNLDC